MNGPQADFNWDETNKKKMKTPITKNQLQKKCHFPEGISSTLTKVKIAKDIPKRTILVG